MPNVSNPDDDLMTAQQEKDLRHALKSQPERAKRRETGTAAAKIENDVISNEGIGAVFHGRQKSETEQALERARSRARQQAGTGRRGRSR